MVKIKILLIACSIIFCINSSYCNIQPLYKIGSYFEFIYLLESMSDTLRFSGRVISDTVILNTRYQVLKIYNEPFRGTYNQYYYYDTTSKVIYSTIGYSQGCFDSTLKQKVIGLNWPEGYIFNTCSDTMGGVFWRSIVNDTGTFTNILYSGIPLRATQRKDTIGSYINGIRYLVYSEMFGFLSLFQNYGSPYGGGWYKIQLFGAIIDSVTYGTILLNVEQTSSEIPDKFTLNQNYPNPFNSSTTIEFKLPRSSNVRLKIFDMLGREMSLLFDERKTAGSYKYRYDGGALSSGIYFYRLETDYVTISKKMIVIK